MHVLSVCLGAQPEHDSTTRVQCTSSAQPELSFTRMGNDAPRAAPPAPPQEGMWPQALSTPNHCSACAYRFEGTFHRRHVCSTCGQVVCGHCLAQGRYLHDLGSLKAIGASIRSVMSTSAPPVAGDVKQCRRCWVRHEAAKAEAASQPGADPALKQDPPCEATSVASSSGSSSASLTAKQKPACAACGFPLHRTLHRSHVCHVCHRTVCGHCLHFGRWGPMRPRGRGPREAVVVCETVDTGARGIKSRGRAGRGCAPAGAGTGTGTQLRLAARGFGTAAASSDGGKGTAGPRDRTSCGSSGDTKKLCRRCFATTKGGGFHDHYRLGMSDADILGRGNWTVRRCVHRLTGTVCAAKCLDRRLMTDSEKKALVDEIALMKMTSGHPNVVNFHRCYDDGEPGLPSFVVMELATGGDVRHLLRRAPNRRLPGRTVAWVAAQLLCALRHLHARGVVHRDVKLDNILIAAPHVGASGGDSDDKNGVANSATDIVCQLPHIKLADFGLSVRLAPARGRDRVDRDHSGVASAGGVDGTDEDLRTMTEYQGAHGAAGTLHYMAPDIFLQSTRGYTCRVDIWSAGVTCFRMIMGRTPFDGKNAGAVRQSIIVGSGAKAAATSALASRRAAMAATKAAAQAFASAHRAMSIAMDITPGSCNSDLSAPVGDSVLLLRSDDMEQAVTATGDHGIASDSDDPNVPSWPVFDLYSDDRWKEVGTDAKYWVRLMLAPMPHLRPGAAALLRSAWLAPAVVELSDIFDQI